MFDIKSVATKIISKSISEIDEKIIYEMLEFPPNDDMGDVALPCFKLSKILRKAPVQIAKELSEKIDCSDNFVKIEAVDGYLNFFLDRNMFINSVIKHVIDKSEDFGSENVGKNRNVVIDFSAPNIAKPFHIGHLRSTVIGNSLYKIFAFMGYNPISINHLGDWGTQFGKLIVAYKKWGNREKIEKDKIKELMKLYVKFHEEAEKDLVLEDEAREYFNKMENGDAETLELWKWFKDLSLDEFQKIYDVLEISFDSYDGESFYNDKMNKTIEELENKNLLKESDGAKIVDLEEYGFPPCLILKKDGSSLYATRDITAAIYRKNNYDFEKCIYVTGSAQNLHFNQWFKVVELMGYNWHTNLIHVPFGLISIGGEKLSTRKGNVVFLEELIDEAIKKTSEIIEQKNPELADKEEIARQIGVGAIIFADLSNNKIKDISFSLDEMLNFDGETGPYVQYANARTCSLISKSGEEITTKFNEKLLESKEEFRLAKTIYCFPGKIKDALNEMEPSIIARYLVDLSQAFNRFYNEQPILVEDDELRASRLALVKATGITIKNGLSLLGIHAPNRI